MLPERVRGILPPDTALTWETIAPIVPPTAYLGGGTAIAVHLAHRVSRDLDFFFHRNSVNLGELNTKLSAAGPFAVAERAPGTLKAGTSYGSSRNVPSHWTCVPSLIIPSVSQCADERHHAGPRR